VTLHNPPVRARSGQLDVEFNVGQMENGFRLTCLGPGRPDKQVERQRHDRHGASDAGDGVSVQGGVVRVMPDRLGDVLWKEAAVRAGVDQGDGLAFEVILWIPERQWQGWLQAVPGADSHKWESVSGHLVQADGILGGDEDNQWTVITLLDGLFSNLQRVLPRSDHDTAIKAGRRDKAVDVFVGILDDRADCHIPPVWRRWANHAQR